MNPRVIYEHDENEQLGLLHAVRWATATKVVDADAGSAYRTMCGEMLYAQSKHISRKRGLPTCVRCVLAVVEEAFRGPQFVQITFP